MLDFNKNVTTIQLLLTLLIIIKVILYCVELKCIKYTVKISKLVNTSMAVYYPKQYLLIIVRISRITEIYV